ncbi:hypothetical protein MUK42_04899 [Musa troglodytarum]|uniref:Uncharacterized protein n=1 Tax=Musa troglodytarum TaxID=320322 RepID=A0A9E7KK12_9LILI|nr:hypothetical protein MUK42_04899 [Musa troglodytarum]
MVSKSLLSILELCLFISGSLHLEVAEAAVVPSLLEFYFYIIKIYVAAIENYGFLSPVYFVKRWTYELK